jgi:hypothetical protein
MRLSSLIALACLALPSAAHAFVCTRTDNTPGAEDGPSLSWRSRDLEFCLQADGTSEITGTLEYDVIRASFGAWGTVYPAGGGEVGGPPMQPDPPFATTDLTFSECAFYPTTRAVGFNYLAGATNENLILFQDDTWPHDPNDHETLALTTTTYNALTGEILDGDIEFNTANLAFAVLPAVGGSGHDLENTAVHEVGHFVGIAHSLVADATMWGSAPPGETAKRSLHADDINGVVFKYPAGADDGYCDINVSGCTCEAPGVLHNNVIVTTGNNTLTEGGCSATAGGWSVGVGCLGAVLLTVSRRRRDRRSA